MELDMEGRGTMSELQNKETKRRPPALIDRPADLHQRGGRPVLFSE